MEVTAGFLVVKTFERMYREYLANFKDWWQVEHPSAVPVLMGQMPGKYRGIARDPIQPWHESFRDTGVAEPTEQELAASLFMKELTDSGRAEDDFIYALEDAIKLFETIPSPVEREIIWARRMDIADLPPPDTLVLGYEPTGFYPSEHSSAILYSAFLRYPRGNDSEEHRMTRFMTNRAMLNRWGLFDTLGHAQEYLDSFPSSSYRDEGVRYIAEIRACKKGRTCSV